MNITHDKALELIKQIVHEEGSQAGAAKRLDISPVYLGDILKGNRQISDQVARKLGYRRVTAFEPLDKK